MPTADVPFKVLVPAFVTSELKSAFQIGFLVFLPFLIIDMIVASVLMSLLYLGGESAQLNLALPSAVATVLPAGMP